VLKTLPRRFACFLGLFCFCAQSLCAEETEGVQNPLASSEDQLISSNAKEQPIADASRWALFRSGDVQEDRYTINFNNVSITEYIRFVSKITG
jgi:type II secretory pathway component GspD/PulD (secretin)